MLHNICNASQQLEKNELCYKGVIKAGSPLTIGGGGGGAWISNYIHYDVWGETTYPFPNFNGSTVEVWEWISNFIPHFTGNVITYPYWD